MKAIVWLFLALLIYAFTVLSPQNYGLDQVELKNEFLDGKFPRVPVAWQLTEAFPNFSISSSITDLRVIPGTDKLLALGKEGLVWVLDNDEADGNAKLVLDISSQVMGNSDAGLLGVAFHPSFNDATSPHSKEIYFFYTYRFEGNQPLYDRLTRFKFSENLDSIIPDSEEVLIQQYDRNWWHNGGAMFFDKEGYLYVSLGDEGGGNDAYKNSQKINTSLFGGIIRIDVDMDSSRSHPIRRYPRSPQGKPAGYPDNINQNYLIPNDNPWISETGSNLEEFFAIGLRSPHRMFYDSLTENIWVADVGQETREEISLISKGSNAQWAYQEGNKQYPNRKPATIIGVETPPIFDYDRNWGGCITGGFVYRGEKYPNLQGKYIFGDYVSKNIWSLDPEQNNKVTFLCKATEARSGIVSFLDSPDGDIYVVTLTGAIFKLSEIIPQETPSLLSQTGAFVDLKDMKPTSGIIPYEVNTPLWSDGASKKRWISIPATSDGITYSPESSWEFPVGTVFIKHFELPVSKDSVVKLETRFFVIGENKQSYGVTYRWNEEGSDAQLIADGELQSREITFIKDEVITSQIWEFPSRAQCLDCHNSNAGHVLGVKTAQLNKSYLYKETGVEDNQLRTWNHVGLFNEDLGEFNTDTLPKLASVTNSSASLQDRVRSYLDANCSFCHRPGGVEAAFDARSSTPIGLQHLIQESVISRNSTEGNKIIKLHDLDSSELWLRDKSLSENKMPPIGKNKLDDGYLKVLKEWILSLQYSVEEAVVCYGDSYTFPDGKTLANIEESFVYSSYLTSSQGLDSIVSTSLVINKHCQEVLLDARICPQDVYIFGEDSLAKTGKYTKVFTSSDNFDSTVVLNLKVEQIDTTLAKSDTALIVNQVGATYQWIDYDAGKAEIEGATDQIYVPSKSGNYGARITVADCSIASEIKNFIVNTITEIDSSDFDSNIKVYPNPVEDYITIHVNDSPASGIIEIMDLQGRLVLSQAFNYQTKISLPLMGMESGTYFLRLTKNDKTAIVKIMKK